MSENITKKLVLIHKNTLKETELVSAFKDDCFIIEVDEVSINDVFELINNEPNLQFSYLTFVFICVISNRFVTSFSNIFFINSINSSDICSP